MSDIPIQVPASEMEEKNHELRAKLEGIRARRRQLIELQHRQAQLSMSLQVERNNAAMNQERALLDFKSALAVNMSNEKLLDLFMQWNALNECFYITHGGPFGTINGLRLGLEAIPVEQSIDSTAATASPPSAPAPNTRRYFSLTSPSPPTSPSSPAPIRVPWTEINAALGQVALLLLTLEKFSHCGIEYRHEIVHQGSTAKIGMRRGTSVSMYNLSHDDSFQLFGRRNFNIAIDCLCECVMDAADAVQRRDTTITLPYEIERTKGELLVGGLPTFISFGQDGTEWTRAMKYLLADIRLIMTSRLFLGSNSSTGTK